MSEFDLHTLAGDVDGTVGAGPRHTHERVVVGAFGVRQHRGQFVVVEREHRGQRGDATTGAHTFGLVDPDLEARFCTHGEQGSGMTLAVVTGAARGLGAAIADRLAQQGYDVARLDVLPGPNVIECDVADRVAVEEVAAGLGPVDVLVNNAGIWRFSALEDVDPIDFDRVLAVNLGGTFHCTQVFGRSMLAAGRGAIVNMVSIAAAAANPSVGAYSASKSGVLALTRQTALEWGPRGVRANAVGPGLVPTEGTGAVYDDPAVREVRAGAVPLRRLGTDADIAGVVAFLVSPDAAYVNGQVLYVDGGLSQALMTLLPRPPGVAGPQLDRT